MIGIGNLLYAALFGWWIALLYFAVGILCFVSLICIPHGKLLFSLGFYYFWPFGKYTEKIKMPNELDDTDDESDSNTYQDIEKSTTTTAAESTNIVQVTEKTALLNEDPNVSLLNDDKSEIPVTQAPKKPADPSPFQLWQKSLSRFLKSLKQRTAYEIIEIILFSLIFSTCNFFFKKKLTRYS